MNRAITLGVKGKSADVIIGHDVDLDAHRRSFKSLRSDPALAEKYDEIQLWTSSGGRTKRHKFNRARLLLDPLATEPAAAEPQKSEPAAPVGDKPKVVKAKGKTSKKAAKAAKSLLE